MKDNELKLKEQIKFLKDVSMSHDALAQFALGMCYLIGYGVKKEHQEISKVASGSSY